MYHVSFNCCGTEALKNPHFSHARHHASHTAVLCPRNPMQLPVSPAPFSNEEPEVCLRESAQGYEEACVHAPRSWEVACFPGAPLAFPSVKWEVTTRLMLQGHGEDQGETLWGSTCQNCWPGAARPVQDEPGSHCLVPLLLGGSCPPLEPSVTSTCPEGEFGVSGQVCVLIEELTALMMIKIYNFI